MINNASYAHVNVHVITVAFSFMLSLNSPVYQVMCDAFGELLWS